MPRGLVAFLVAVGVLIPSAVGWAWDADPQGTEFFETKIRPVLVAKCYECHSANSARLGGSLLLDSREGIRRGGDTGPAIVPGNPDDSLLLSAIRHEGLTMPSAEEKLSEVVIADFAAWIQRGAPDPRTEAATAAYRTMTLDEARSFWSLRPIAPPPVPQIQNAAWPRADIDRFILNRLEAEGLAPVADVDRRTLIRRLFFDLIGLPPQPEEVEAFVQDTAHEAIEKLVDRLLASPHFGERWGRYWLDVARYAESNGNADNIPFPDAWRYRDYVIAALNKDKPYDQFLREQIAGDLLDATTSAERDEYLIATGFLALTSRPRNQNNPDYRMDIIADQIDVTSRAILGISVICARCHNHKFDPIPTQEYYALAGIFESTELLVPGGVRGGGPPKAHTLSDGGSAMGVRDGNPVNAQVRIHGESQQRGESVARGFLTIATQSSAPTITASESGRLQLAEWLTRPDNPLTARVAVNRVWLHLFGQALVRSPDNFGSLGERPSHPELLDALAVRFMEDGWSLKRLIRTIVLSRTYRMGSTYDSAHYEADPDNRWLWRMNHRRLDAEATRDAILSVSDQLDSTPPDGSQAPALSRRRARQQPPPKEDVRSIYLGINRGVPLPEALALFDVANPNLVVAQREATTTPAQALFLMNSPFVVEHARHMADRLLATGRSDAELVDLAYRLALARPADDAERERVLHYVQESLQDRQTTRRDAWADFCQVLMASAEFRYLR